MMSMRSLPLLACLLGPACGGGNDPGGSAGATVTVMTRNLYLGADLMPVVNAQTVEAIPGLVAGLWKTVNDSDFPGRAKALAVEIAGALPDLVGLQEAALFRQQMPSDFSFDAPAVNASVVVFDFLDLLQSELAARGAEYEVAVVSSNADVELPALDPGGQRFDVRITDRDAVLVHKGSTTVSARADRYPSSLPFRIPLAGPVGVPVDLVRGLGRVEVVVDGARLTFANTHLEVSGGPGNVLGSVQEGQARDLVGLLGAVAGPVVLVGDFNSPADGTGTRSYATVAARLADAYQQIPGLPPALTCCNSIDAPQFVAHERIDIVFVGGGVRAHTLDLVGTDPAGRALAGRWPSDHAGVVAALTVPR
jgi:hypothetical protein